MGGDDILKMAALLKLLNRLNNSCSLLVWDLLLLDNWKEMWSYLPYCAFDPTILFLGVLLLFSCSVMSDSLQPYGLQHSRIPCPSRTPGACSNSCPSSRWWHPAISSCVFLFSSCLQSFPASGSFLRSQFFASGGQSIGASASASVLPVNIQDWFLLRSTCLISLKSKELWRVFFNTTVQKHQFFSTQPSLWSNSHIHTWLL